MTLVLSAAVPAGDDLGWTASSTRIRQELGYEESVTIEESIRRTIRWERENPAAAALLAQFDYAAEDAAVAGQPMS